ncbi:MAG: transposase [Lachnospiraceae bacterium]|jgi:transposase InsO family protein|nr:transposase [Lachnospiraceae bacterium]
MFHSDRGSQDTAFSFWQLLDSLNVVQSFSKKGEPFYNTCCECFFKYLKKEETNRRAYHSLQELQLSVFEYIEGFYSSKRPHGTLGMLTPNEKEELSGIRSDPSFQKDFSNICVYLLDYGSSRELVERKGQGGTFLSL